MIKLKKFIIYAICFTILIIGAKFGYDYLSQNYELEALEKDIFQNESVKNSGENALSGDVTSDDDSNDDKTADFEVINMSGEKVKLSDYFGKPIVVNFWASWCGPCKAELPEFMEAYKKYGKDVEFLMVNLTDGYTDTVEGVKEFIKKNKYEFPVYFDTQSNAADAYQVYSIPQTLFIDAEGNLIKSYIGMINGKILDSSIGDVF